MALLQRGLEWEGLAGPLWQLRPAAPDTPVPGYKLTWQEALGKTHPILAGPGSGGCLGSVRKEEPVRIRGWGS